MTIEQVGARVVLRLKGRIDIDSSPDLREQLLQTLGRRDVEAIQIDLTDVPYMDTSAIATLIEGLKLAHGRRRALHLQGLTGSVRHLFDIAGVLSLFEDLDSAGSAGTKVL